MGSLRCWVLATEEWRLEKGMVNSLVTSVQSTAVRIPRVAPMTSSVIGFGDVIGPRLYIA